MPNPDDLNTVSDLKLAAFGDGAAQLRLARKARDLVLSGEGDEIVCSIEGVAYARLAAAQGSPDALMLLAEHCAHLSVVYSDCGVEETSDMWLGQALGVLELATELLPDCNAAELMHSLNLAADSATPEIMREVKHFRDLFAPAFGAEAFA